MAATNAYYCISRLMIDSVYSVDDAVFTGATPLASGNSAAFPLKGGQYGVDVLASTFGTVTLKKLAQDGTSYVAVMTAFSANGYNTVYIPPGTYRIELA